MVTNKIIKEAKWPIIETLDLEKTTKFYVENLHFELVERKNDYYFLKLFDFYLFLKKVSEYSKNQKLSNLYIPVEKLDEYYNIVKTNAVKFIYHKKMVYYDFEAFGIFDNEDNRIIFFKDYHGPFTAKLWYWGNRP